MEWLLGLCAVVVVVVVGIVLTRRGKSKNEETYTVEVSTDRYEPSDTVTVDSPTVTTEPLTVSSVPAPPLPSAPKQPEEPAALVEPAAPVAEVHVTAEATQLGEPEAKGEPDGEVAHQPAAVIETEPDTVDAVDVAPETTVEPVVEDEPEQQETPASAAAPAPASAAALKLETEPELEPEPELEDELEPEATSGVNTSSAARLFVDLRKHPERQLRVLVEDAEFADLDDDARRTTFYVLRREEDSADNPHAIAVLLGDRKIGVLAESAAKHYAPLFDQLDADVLAKTTGQAQETDRVFLPRVPTLRALIADGVTTIDESVFGESPVTTDAPEGNETTDESIARELVSAGQSA